MKISVAVLAAAIPAISARFVEPDEINHVQLYPDGAKAPKFLVEIAPGETISITEEEKWELRRNGRNFIDVTNYQDLGRIHSRTLKKGKFPQKCEHQDAIKPLLKELAKDNMRKNLERFTSFHTRYYKSEHGRESSKWLLSRIQDIINDAGANETVTAVPFQHSWPQSSIIARIPGKSERTIVIGAHQDSINLWLPSVLAAPGADDDGSGTVTILEVFRALLTDKDVVDGKSDNTIEFHWYSAEEAGLLGSQAIFSEYEKEGRDIKAMLQQDMTGHVQRTLDNGAEESVGVITDFVDPNLTNFIKTVITEYCTIPYVETKCGYACSDHASASKAGYPSAFVIESAFENSNQHIHTTEDVIDRLSFDHMLEHARMTLGFVYELGHADFKSLESGSPSDEL